MILPLERAKSRTITLRSAARAPSGLRGVAAMAPGDPISADCVEELGFAKAIRKTCSKILRWSRTTGFKTPTTISTIGRQN
jgi:hypothetical protein